MRGPEYDASIMHLDIMRNTIIFKKGLVEPCTCGASSAQDLIRCIPTYGDVSAECYFCSKEGPAAGNPREALEKWNKMMVVFKYGTTMTVPELLDDIDRKLS